MPDCGLQGERQKPAPLEPEPAYPVAKRTGSRISLSIVAPKSRLKVLNSVFEDQLVSLRPTHPTISELTSPLTHWVDSDLLVIELPVLEFGKQETHLAVQRLLLRTVREGRHVMLVVTPRDDSGDLGRHQKTASKGKEAMERPIRRWNDWNFSPFLLRVMFSACIAQTGNGRSQPHLR